MQNNLTDKQQSTLKEYHSTETLQTKHHNNIVSSMGKGGVSILVLLDFSAPFDAANHKILFEWLMKR